MKKLIITVILGLIFIFFLPINTFSNQPIPLVVIGASHGHISFILNRENKNDFVLKGIYEPDSELVENLKSRFKVNSDLFYNDLNSMLDEVKPRAAVVFGSIYGHLEAVEACAPRKIDVMVEKPLTTHVKYAKRMQSLKDKYNIKILTNYETSWYPTIAKSLKMVEEEDFVGKLKKVVFYTGHQGPVEIGCDKYFLSWLTDPKLNGGGALFDFGCYGANIMTALMKGEEPISVTAVTKNYKPTIYPKVDDDATITLNYKNTSCVIQTSWNWPYNRKEMEIYGDKGAVFQKDNQNMVLKNRSQQSEKELRVTEKDIPVYTDPFVYFADVINGKIEMKPYDLYSFENNVTVVKILEAARESARKNKTIFLK